jgi:DNA polymerase III epsilon subunit-like protein
MKVKIGEMEMPAPNSLLNLNGNMMVAVDVETTGRVAGFHEIIQIAVVRLTSEIEPVPDINPFYMNIAPAHPERCEHGAQMVHGLDIEELMSNCPDAWKVADLFDEWFQNLNLPFQRSLMPLAHNWAFERGFLTNWLGIESFNQFFHPHPRDTMLFALSINDAATYHGLKTPFPYVSLGAVCKKYGIVNDNAHDALGDALAEAKLYKAMLASFGR